MKNCVLAYCVLLSFAFRMDLQETEGKPAIRFDTVFHDFGTMKEGTVMDYAFRFRNTGNSPLLIVNVEQPCGCTTPSWSKEPVMPGQFGEVKVTFNSKNRSG